MRERRQSRYVHARCYSPNWAIKFESMKRILIAFLSVSCTVFAPAAIAQTAKKTTPTSTTHATTKPTTSAKTSAGTKTSASSKTATPTKTAAKTTTKPKSASAPAKGTTAAAAKTSHGTSKHGRNTAVAHRPSYQTTPTPDRYQQIQQSLADRGFYKGEVNGVWGADSVDAMKSFQASQNLPDDGKITSKALIGLGLGSSHASPPGANPPGPNQPGTPLPPTSAPVPPSGDTAPAVAPANPPQPTPPSVTSQR